MGCDGFIIDPTLSIDPKLNATCHMCGREIGDDHEGCAQDDPLPSRDLEAGFVPIDWEIDDAEWDYDDEIDWTNVKQR